jgi:hypothetical protein
VTAVAIGVEAPAGPLAVEAATQIDSVTVQGAEVRGRVGQCGATTVVLDATGFATTWSPAEPNIPLIDAAAGVERLRALPQPAIAELCRPAADGDGCLSSQRDIVAAAPGLMRDVDLATNSAVIVPAWIYTVRTTLVEPDGSPATSVPDGVSEGTLVVMSIADSALATAPPGVVSTGSADAPDGGSGTSVPGVPGEAVPPAQGTAEEPATSETAP